MSPYTTLLNEIKEFCRKLRYPHEETMFLYPKSDLSKNWSLSDLYERTKAAEQLGYDVIVQAHEKGLSVIYRKRNPTIPYMWE